MPYFQRFPEITYMGLKITDISFRVALYEKLNSNVSSFEPYRIKNGDKIEDLAHKLYGNSNLFWIIMITNNLTDPFYDWPLNDLELDEYIVGKYGIGNENDIHHYENTSGRIVPESYPGSIPITNQEHESAENEEMREIKLLKPGYVSRVLAEFEDLLGNA